jgi:iron complex transport system substrate-binding protein
VTSGLGTVEIPAPPQRIVAVGSSELDVLLALGIVPVAYATYDDGLLPYQLAALDGRAAPDVLSLADGIPFEAIAGYEPDLIVNLSWSDADNYAVLSRVAPVVAFVADPWGDSWQTQVRQIAHALGRDGDGAAAIQTVEQEISATAAAHPELADRTVTFTSADGSGALCSVDLPTAPVLEFLRELGMRPTLSDPASSYCAEISPEELERIDADVMLLFGAREELEASPLYRELGAVERDAVVWIDDAMANAVNSPTPLAIPAFLEAVVPAVAAAAG